MHVLEKEKDIIRIEKKKKKRKRRIAQMGRDEMQEASTKVDHFECNTGGISSARY